MDITRRERLTFMAAALCREAAFIYVMMYLAARYEQELGVSALLLSAGLFAAKFLGGAADFIIGLLIDLTDSRFGKYKPAILAGALLFSAGAAAHQLLLGPDTAPELALACHVALCICAGLMEVGLWAMMPGFGSATSSRESMAMNGRIGAFIGYEATVLAILAVTWHTGRASIYLPELFWAALLVLLLSQLAALLWVTDRSRSYSSSQHLAPARLIRIFLANDQLHITALIIFLLQSAHYLSLAAVSGWAAGRGDGGWQLMSAAAAGMLGGLLSYGLYAWLYTRLPRMIIFMGACMVCVLGQAVLAAALLSGSAGVLLGGQLLAFAGQASLSVCTMVMLANTADYGEFQTNVRIEGLSMSMLSLSTKVATALGMLICHAAAVMAAPSGGTPPVPLSLGPLLAMGSVALAVFTYVSLYKLKGSFYIHMLNTLDRLRGLGDQQELNYTSVRYALDESSILMHLEDCELTDVLEQLTGCIAATQAIGDPAQFRRDLMARLEAGPCGIADGIAIAHAKSEAVLRPALAIATLRSAIDCGAIDGRSCDLIFLIASPADARAHLNLLGKLSLLLNEAGLCDELRVAGSTAEIVERIFSCEKYLMLRGT